MSSDAIPLLASLMRLWDATYDRVRQLPKFDKHLIGRMLLDDLDACMLEILLACNAYEHRSAHLTRASAHFDAAKIRIRIMVRRELLTERWYASQLDTLADIGKQIGGWRRRATRRRYS